MEREEIKEGSRLALPAVRGGALVELLRTRRSVKRYDAGRHATREQLARLCWAAQGVTEPVRGKRTAPSAGALYPLELYVFSREGVFHYDPPTHELACVRARDERDAVAAAALDQDVVRNADFVFVFSAVPQRTRAKYGRRSSERYVMLEGGHAAENLVLEAAELGLGARVVGAFHEDQLRALLVGAATGTAGTVADEVPLCLVVVGYAA